MEKDSRTNLIAAIDLKRDVVQGEWYPDGEMLRSGSSGGTIAIPSMPPRHFELRLRVKRLAGRTAFSIGILRNDISCLAILDNWEGSGLENIDGKRRRENGTYIPGSRFTIGQETEVVFRVDGKRVACTIDGTSVIDWAGDYRRTSMSGNQRLLGAPNGRLCLYSDSGSVFQIRSLTLTPLEAQATR
jgi:hypothetical protein